MSDALGTIEKGAEAVGRLLGRLIQSLDSGDPGPGLKALVAELGWALPDPLPPSLLGLKDSTVALAHAVEKLASLRDTGASDAELLAAAVSTVAALADLISKITALPAALTAELPAGFVAATHLPDEFAERLFGTLVVDALRRRVPITSRVLRLLGLLEIARKPADPALFQPEFELRRIHWERISALLSDPVQVFRDVYGWGSPSINLEPLQDALFSLSHALGLPGAYDYPSLDLLHAMAPAVTDPTKSDRIFELTLLDAGPAKIAVALTAIPKSSPAEVQGVALTLTASADLDKIEVLLRPNITLSFDASLDASEGLLLVLRPGEPPSLFTSFESGGTPVPRGKLLATLSYSRMDNEDPFTMLSFPGGSGLNAREAYLAGGLALTPTGDVDPSVEAGVKKAKLVLSMSQADGFLAKLFPADGISVDFDIGLGWSRSRGIFFQGSAGLEISVPLHVGLGPITLDSIYLAIKLAGGNLAMDAALSAEGKLGPLSASVDRIGVTATTTFPDHGGNLGPANIALAFKPPNGIGLAIDAGVVKGGGYLFIDTDRGEYAGALELVFADFLGLHAIGLITTKMPDGSKGFSLLVIITADFGSGIQLSFGFTLLAVGGLLGLNRVMLFQPLMDGIRTGSIESIMFPKDVVANAPRIISDLRAIFPPQEGTFLVGPMGKLGWGQPTLISLSLGIIVEIPPGEIAILGILKLALPAEDIAVLVLQVNFAGALEFDKKRFYFFASLFDSHLLFITLEGEMGVLMAFGDDANFVVSVGGFHPKFNPPPLPFPSPRRIEVSIINESYARIRCDAYFAVTTNTVQFGSHAEYFFGLSALNLSGHSGFDALIQVSPFHFIVSISTAFSVKVFGVGVYGIHMDLTLEGPTPWHAHGTASISFFFFSIGIGVDFTWGDRRNTALPPVTVMPILSGEFSKRSNWRAVLPTGSNLLVSLRQLDPSDAGMVLHPVGTLHVSQRAIPLDLTLDKVGSQQPNDASHFSLDVTSAGLAKVRTLQEPFAPAQFKNMDDAAKLSQPAFTPLDSGVELSAAGNAYASATAITRNVRYDLTIIDTKFRRVSRRFFVLAGSLFAHFLGGASVTRSAFSAYRKGQTQPFEEKVTVRAERFAVALQSNNKAHSPDSVGFTSQVAAEEYLSRALARDPNLAGELHVLPEFEVAA